MCLPVLESSFLLKLATDYTGSSKSAQQRRTVFQGLETRKQAGGWEEAGLD